jgi:hypothetical protein
MFITVICAHILIKSTVRIALTSTRVEEMYNKQLVVTLDSILDAHLNAATNKEVIDSDDVSVPHDRFGRVLVPME